MTLIAFTNSSIFDFKDMHYKFCVSVWNNLDEYVYNIEKLKSMTFFVLLVYI